MKTSITIAAAGLLLATTGWALAESVTVTQENKKFSEASVTIKQGETVTYTNKDPITHNVFSNTPGMAFDLRTQKPGQSSDVTFSNVGQADVQCAIHPQMKMKVKVEP